MMICVVKPVLAGVQPRFVSAALGITGAVGSVGGSSGGAGSGAVACGNNATPGATPGAVRGPRGRIDRPIGSVGRGPRRGCGERVLRRPEG